MSIDHWYTGMQLLLLSNPLHHASSPYLMFTPQGLMDEVTRTAFCINLYNMMVIHKVHPQPLPARMSPHPNEKTGEVQQDTNRAKSQPSHHVHVQIKHAFVKKGIPRSLLVSHFFVCDCRSCRCIRIYCFAVVLDAGVISWLFPVNGHYLHN